MQIKELDSEEELNIVESKIIIKDSVFENDVDFSNTRFRKALNFHDTFFLGETDFSGARFSGDVDFSGADFSERVDFTDASFSGDAIFHGRDFGHAEFKGARFDGVARFGDVDFDYAEFMDARFSGYTTFWGARFDGDARFNGASFCDDAQFSDTRFSGNAYLGASFHEVYFENTRFGGNADFRGASCNGYAIFRHVIFSDNTNFNEARFNKVVFTNTTFTKVDFSEIGFKSLKVEWTPLKDALVFDGPTYIKLIKNFREVEQFGDADDAYYQYRRLSQENKKWSFSKLSDRFMQLSCGYGVRPWYAAVWTVAITFMWALFYWLWDGIRRSKNRNKDDEQDASFCGAFYFIMVAATTAGFMYLFHDCGWRLQDTIILAGAMIFICVFIYIWQYRLENNIGKKGASFCDAFYFSVVTFTTVGYGDWYPKNRYRILAVIEGLLGWLTLALFLVTLANVMIRP